MSDKPKTDRLSYAKGYQAGSKRAAESVRHMIDYVDRKVGRDEVIEQLAKDLADALASKQGGGR